MLRIVNYYFTQGCRCQFLRLIKIISNISLRHCYREKIQNKLIEPCIPKTNPFPSICHPQVRFPCVYTLQLLPIFHFSDFSHVGSLGKVIIPTFACPPRQHRLTENSQMKTHKSTMKIYKMKNLTLKDKKHSACQKSKKKKNCKENGPLRV